MSDTSPRAKRAGEGVTLPQATAYERWELPNVESAGPVTVDQLQRVQDTAYREAYAAGQEKGYEDGYRRGCEAGEQRLQEVVERLRDLVTALAEPVQCLDDEVEQTLVTLSMAVARQLVYGELHHDPDRVADAVRQALSVLPLTDRDVRIYLNPQDVVSVREAMAVEANERSWTLLEDPLLERGGCRVESADSRIDASVGARLMTVISQVLGGESPAADGADGSPGSADGTMDRIRRIFDADD